MPFPTGGLLGSHLVRGTLYGAGFALVELLFTATMKEQEDGSLRFAPDLKGHTTWAMVPGSMLGGLYVIEPLIIYVRPFPEPWANLALRLLLWPFAIWLIELLWGALLFYGCNGTRAWHYKGLWARCKGFIKLSMVLDWMALGLLCEGLWYGLFQ